MAGARQERRILFNAARDFTRESVATVFRPDVVLYESQVPGMPSYAVEISDALSRPRGDRMVSLYRIQDVKFLPIVRFFLNTQTNTIDRRFGLFVHRYQHEGTSRLVSYYQVQSDGSADLQAAAYYKGEKGKERRVWGIQKGVSNKQFDAKIRQLHIPASIDVTSTVRRYLTGEYQDEQSVFSLTAQKIHRQPVIPFSGE